MLFIHRELDDVTAECFDLMVCCPLLSWNLAVEICVYLAWLQSMRLLNTEKMRRKRTLFGRRAQGNEDY